MAKLTCSSCRHHNRDGEHFSLGLCLCQDSENFAMRMIALGTCSMHQPIIKDLSFGPDHKGDHTLFIDKSRINGSRIDREAKNVIGTDAVYFRVLEDGKETETHGWIKKKRIVMFL